MVIGNIRCKCFLPFFSNFSESICLKLFGIPKVLSTSSTVRIAGNYLWFFHGNHDISFFLISLDVENLKELTVLKDGFSKNVKIRLSGKYKMNTGQRF